MFKYNKKIKESYEEIVTKIFWFRQRTYCKRNFRYCLSKPQNLKKTYNAVMRGVASLLQFSQSQEYGAGRHGSPLHSPNTSNVVCNKAKALTVSSFKTS